MANVLTNFGKKEILDSYFGSGTFKVMLLDSNHSNDIDTQETIDDVDSNEITGTGYTAGGQELTNVAVTVDDGDDEGVVDADNVVWTGDIIARYAVIYKDTGTPSTSTIIGILDFGADKESSNSDFEINFDSEGMFNLN